MVTLNGSGEIVLASVIGGTTARPFLDDVCAIIVWMAFVKVNVKAVWAFSRPGYRNKLHGILVGRVCIGNSPSFVGCRNYDLIIPLLWCCWDLQGRKTHHCSQRTSSSSIENLFFSSLSSQRLLRWLESGKESMPWHVTKAAFNSFPK